MVNGLPVVPLGKHGWRLMVNGSTKHFINRCEKPTQKKLSDSINASYYSVPGCVVNDSQAVTTVIVEMENQKQSSMNEKQGISDGSATGTDSGFQHNRKPAPRPSTLTNDSPEAKPDTSESPSTYTKKHGDSSVSTNEAPQGISVSGAVFECFHQHELAAQKEEQADNQAYQEHAFGNLKEMHENVGTNPMQAPAEVLPSFDQPNDHMLCCSFDLPYYKPSTSHKLPQIMGYRHELVSVASVIAPGASCTPLAHSNKCLLEDEATGFKR